jgi:hypothetical protein
LAVITPDERTFRDHVAAARFQLGVDRGDWRLVSDSWPNPVIGVSAAAQDSAPAEFAFRFELTDYPASAPTSEPWDVAGDTPLSHDCWPAGSGRVAIVFNPGWRPNENVHALYHPIDRRALVGHDNWRAQDPASIWDPSRMDIVDYLKVVHELLHSLLYQGIRQAA